MVGAGVVADVGSGVGAGVGAGGGAVGFDVGFDVGAGVCIILASTIRRRTSARMTDDALYSGKWGEFYFSQKSSKL